MAARLARPSFPLVALALLAGVGGLALALGPATFLRTAALLGVVGALSVAWRVDPAWALAGGIVLAAFSGNWEQLGLGFPLVPDRLLLFAGMAGAAGSVLWRRESPAPRVEAAHVFLGLASLYAIGSALWVGATDRDSAFELLDRLGLVPFAMFVVAAVAFRSERHRAILLASLVGLGGYLGLTSLFEATGAHSLVFPGYITDPSVGGQAGRARGPFASSVANGLALYECAVAAAIALAYWTRPWARAGAAGVGLLCSAGLLFAVTRSVWLASVVATVLTLLAFRELRRYLLPAIAAGLVLVLGSLAVVPGLAERVRERSQVQISVWDRRNTNAAALNMIAERPLLGFGWDQFDVVGRDYFELLDDYPQTGADTTVHNVFLSHLAELGMVGAGLWGLAFALAIGGAIMRRGPPELRPWRIGLLAIAAHWIVVANFVPLPYAFPNLLLWTWAGIVAGGALAGGGSRARA